MWDLDDLCLRLPGASFAQAQPTTVARRPEDAAGRTELDRSPVFLNRRALSIWGDTQQLDQTLLSEATETYMQQLNTWQVRDKAMNNLEKLREEYNAQT